MRSSLLSRLVGTWLGTTKRIDALHSLGVAVKLLLSLQR
jgi:hypothetical protein